MFPCPGAYPVDWHHVLGGLLVVRRGVVIAAGERQFGQSLLLAVHCENRIVEYAGLPGGNSGSHVSRLRDVDEYPGAYRQAAQGPGIEDAAAGRYKPVSARILPDSLVRELAE